MLLILIVNTINRATARARTYREPKSDVRIRFWAARVLGVSLLRPDLQEIPLDALVVGTEIHTIVNLVQFGTPVFLMIHINLIEQTNGTLSIVSQIQTTQKLASHSFTDIRRPQSLTFCHSFIKCLITDFYRAMCGIATVSRPSVCVSVRS